MSNNNDDFFIDISDHPEPNIIDDDDGVNSGNADSDDKPVLQTTETDLMFDMLANPDKLVPQQERQGFVKPPPMETIAEEDNEKSEEVDEDDDDNFDDFVHKSNDSERHVSSKKQGYVIPKHTFDNDNSHEYDKLSPKELRLRKLDMMSKLLELTKYGIKLSHNYSMNDSLEAMTYEYNLHRNIRSKQNGVKWMSNALLTTIHGLEMMNESTYNPFKLELTGWSQVMSSEINSYYDVLGDLYDKYSRPGGSVAPEVKLMMMVGGSAMKFHLMKSFLEKDKLGDQNLTKELRQQAIQEQYMEQQHKQNQFHQQRMQMEHQRASQDASDLEMLKFKNLQQMNMRQEMELANKQSELDRLQQQLEMISQHSKKEPIMKPPRQPTRQQAQQIQHQQLLNTRRSELNPQQHQQLLRNEQLKHEKAMKHMNENIKLMKGVQQDFEVNPDMDEILSRATTDSDDTDTTSSGSIVDASDVSSSNSGVRIRRKKSKAKKRKVKIGT